MREVIKREGLASGFPYNFTVLCTSLTLGAGCSHSLDSVS